MVPLDLMSEDHFGPGLSAFFMDGVGKLAFAVLIGLAVLVYRRKMQEARAADATFDENTQLKLGETVISGLVERAEGSGTAVRVEIDQYGEESESSGVWSHKWTEKNRRVLVEPFYVRLPSKVRVRVEPGEDVYLVDEMDGLVRVDLKHRTRYAELTPRERVFAAGVLTRGPDPEAAPGEGYRGKREGYLLRPKPGGKMLLSSEALGDRFRERASFHLRWAMIIGMAAAAVHAIFFGYEARRFLGSREDVVVEALVHYTTSSDNGDVDHWRVDMVADDGIKIRDEIDSGPWHELKKGDRVPALVVRGSFVQASTIGPDRTVSGMAGSALAVLIAMWIAYRVREKQTRPWYEKVVVDKGSGKLEETLEAEKRRSKRSTESTVENP